MSNADAQSDQRRANLAAIEALGFPAYAHQFATTHTVGQLVDAHTDTPAGTLEAHRLIPVLGGRAAGSADAG